MLVLSRRPGSTIVIDHHVRITVEGIVGDDVCLSVDGPEGTVVQRVEVVDMARELSARGREWDRARMHVLSRRARPALLIRDNVRVAILAISSEAVRIGVDAPPTIEVHREEVYRQIQAANRLAVSAPEAELAGLTPFVPPMPG